MVEWPDSEADREAKKRDLPSIFVVEAGDEDSACLRLVETGFDAWFHEPVYDESDDFYVRRSRNDFTARAFPSRQAALEEARLGRGTYFDVDFARQIHVLPMIPELQTVEEALVEASRPVVYVLFGESGSGKDTAAGFIEDATKLRFAYGVKRAAMAITGMPEHVAFATDQAARLEWEWLGKTAREWLQLIGTEVGRSLDPDIWIHRTLEAIPRGPGTYVICDGRFPNEATRPREIRPDVRFVNILIRRPGLKRDAKVSSHSSEQWVAGREAEAMMDHVVWNIEDSDALETQIRRIVG